MRLDLFIRSLAFATTVLLIPATIVRAVEPSSAEPAATVASEAPLADSVGTPEPADLGELRSLRVAGSVLRSRSSADGTSASLSGGCIYNSSGSAIGVLNTPLQLPDGATVNTLRMYYYDTSDTNSNGWFTIYDLYGNLVEEFVVSSAGTPGNNFNDSAVINRVIDYSNYSYVLNWRPNVAGSSMQLCGFRIFYEN